MKQICPSASAGGHFLFTCLSVADSSGESADRAILLVTSSPATNSPALRPPLPLMARWNSWQISSPAIAFWLAIQIGCMAIALLHVPLAAEYTITERLMPEVLLAGQFASAAILTPLLCRSLGTTFVAAASVWPAVILAGGLAMRPTATSLLAAAAVTFWLLLLWIWCSVSMNKSIRAVLSAIATLIAVGPQLANYLQKDFGGAESGARWPAVAPIAAGWQLAEGTALNFAAIVVYSSVAAVGILLLILRTRRVGQSLPEISDR
jgi:hypothetical protein